MKTRNASKNVFSKVEPQTGKTNSVMTLQSKIKKGIKSKNALKTNKSVRLGASDIGQPAQQSASGSNLSQTSKNPERKKGSSGEKQTSVFLDVIAKSSLETTPLTCGYNRVGIDFYDVPCEQLARTLLGQVLVRRLDNGTLLRGKIVETECYLGGEDKASQSFNGKMTERNLPMFMKPGTAYVYLTYGMYHCFNISSHGTGAAVLLRALEPVEGSDHMLQHRIAGSKRKTSTDQPSSKPKKPLQEHELCNGPAKLCMSFRIEKLSCNRRNLSEWDGMWVERGAEGVEVREHQVVKTSRIGIESAGVEWATKPLRFYLVESSSVSRRDKKKEQEFKFSVN